MSQLSQGCLVVYGILVLVTLLSIMGRTGTEEFTWRVALFAFVSGPLVILLAPIAVAVLSSLVVGRVWDDYAAGKPRQSPSTDKP
jgi:hypothetical protein